MQNKLRIDLHFKILLLTGSFEILKTITKSKIEKEHFDTKYFYNNQHLDIKFNYT